MKYIFIVLFILFAQHNFAHAESKCAGVLAKLKAECNIVGKGMNKMKEFSKENKNLGQVKDNIGKGVNKLKKNFK